MIAPRPICCKRAAWYSDGMITTIDKAGRVVIPAAIRERANFVPGTTLEISVDEFGVRLERRAPGPKLIKIRGRLVARPTVKPDARPVLNVADLVEEERNRWP
jgi:AbrB family looped-hinge helix DNA binding protein